MKSSQEKTMPTKIKYTDKNGEEWTVAKLSNHTGLGVAWANTKMHSIISGVEHIENVLMENAKTRGARIRIIYDEKIWTSIVLHEYANNKSMRWCGRYLRKVKNNEMRMDVVLEMAKKSKGTTKFIFIGKPTKKYPNGRVYTPQVVIEEVAKKGKSIGYTAACNRIDKAIKGRSLEREILRPREESQVRDVRGYYKEEISLRRKRNYEILKAANNKEINFNEFCGG